MSNTGIILNIVRHQHPSELLTVLFVHNIAEDGPNSIMWGWQMFVLHGNIADSPRQVIDALAASGLVRQILIVPVALLLEHIKTNKLFKKISRLLHFISLNDAAFAFQKRAASANSPINCILRRIIDTNKIPTYSFNELGSSCLS